MAAEGDSWDRMSLATRISSMYHQDTDLAKVAAEIYTEDACYEDPFASASGRASIVAQFKALQLAVSSSRTQFVSSNRSGDRQTIESIFHFKLKFWPFQEFRWRVFTVLELEPESSRSRSPARLSQPGGEGADRGIRRVKKHMDHWSVGSMIDGLPVVGWLYDTGRKIFGVVLSVVIGTVWGTGGGSGAGAKKVGNGKGGGST